MLSEKKLVLVSQASWLLGSCAKGRMNRVSANSAKSDSQSLVSFMSLAMESFLQPTSDRNSAFLQALRLSLGFVSRQTYRYLRFLFLCSLYKTL